MMAGAKDELWQGMWSHVHWPISISWLKCWVL